MNDKRTIIYNRESLISSIVADIISFGGLIGLMFLNFDYWDGHWYLTIFIAIMWLIVVLAKASKRIHTFYSIEDCIEYLKKELPDGGA